MRVPPTPVLLTGDGGTDTKTCHKVGKAHTVELLNVGGNANNGSHCGLSYTNSNNGFSNSNTNIGARLKFCEN